MKMESFISDVFIYISFKINIMRKVKIDFFCIKTKKSYKKGDVYKGKRTDINHVLEPKKKKEDKRHPKTRKGAIEKK